MIIKITPGALKFPASRGGKKPFARNGYLYYYETDYGLFTHPGRARPDILLNFSETMAVITTTAP